MRDNEPATPESERQIVADENDKMDREATPAPGTNRNGERTAAEPEFEPYINKRELAKRLGRTVRSVDTYLSKGLPHYKFMGKSVGFKWSEVDDYLRTHWRVGAHVRG